MSVEQTGFIPSEPTSTDYIAGEVSGIQYSIILKDGNWMDFEPDGERQNTAFKFDTMSCVTFSALNALEMQIKLLIKENKLSRAHLDFLKDYMIGGEVNFSDRYTAILSGTTKTGNTFQKVADSIRNLGAIPQAMLPYGDAKTWEQWHDKSVITADMIAKGQQFRKLFDIQYEWVYNGSLNVNESKKQIKQAPLQIAVPLQAQHAIVMTNIKDKDSWNTFDSYPPYRDRVKWNGTKYGFKIVITPKEAQEDTWNYKYFGKNEQTGHYTSTQMGTCSMLRPELLEMLDKAREIAGIPFKILSGLRSDTYNKQIGGATNSAHLRGYAVDIYCKDSEARARIWLALVAVGFERFGIDKNYIHVDCDPSLPSPRVWHYY